MQRSWGERFIAVISIIIFTATAIIGPAVAAPVNLPLPSDILSSSLSYTPVLLKGLTIDAQNPFAFRFVADAAETGLEGQSLQDETVRLVRYFITSLAIPESDMWVNLSPLEKDRIIPDTFGKTEMGRDLLAQDYILKQVTAGFLNPENEVGKKFWDKVYESANDNDQSVQEAVESFNKVWIVPDQASVYQHGNSVFVGEARLKVMMEGDYEAQQNLKLSSSNVFVEDPASFEAQSRRDVVKTAFREIIIPAIEREVNEGQNFAPLRQVYNAMLLAVWYKKVLKESVLGGVFVDRQNIKGIDPIGRDDIESIYNRYVDAFQKGASSVIAERYDPVSGQIVPQMYFSGGAIAYNRVQLNVTNQTQVLPYFSKNIFDVSVDFAQMADEHEDRLSRLVHKNKLIQDMRQQGYEVKETFDPQEKGYGVLDFTTNASTPDYRVNFGPNGKIQRDAHVEVFLKNGGDEAQLVSLARFSELSGVDFAQMVDPLEDALKEAILKIKPGTDADRLRRLQEAANEKGLSVEVNDGQDFTFLENGKARYRVYLDNKRNLSTEAWPDEADAAQLDDEKKEETEQQRLERLKYSSPQPGDVVITKTYPSATGQTIMTVEVNGELNPWETTVTVFNGDGGNAAMLAKTNGGIDLKDASDIFDLTPGGTMIFPRMADFPEAEFNLENVSPRVGIVSPMSRAELDSLLGIAQ